MHILFVWEQGLGYGHLGHLYPAARLMKAQGHRVTLAVRHVENVWAAADMPFDLVVPAPNVRAAKPAQDTRTFSDVIRPSGFATRQMLTACTRAWHMLFDLIKPDALVCDHAYNAVFAAMMRGLPAARMGTGFTVPKAQADLPALRTWEPHERDACREADAALLDVLQQSAADFEAQPVTDLAKFFGCAVDFTCSWPELDHLGPQQSRFYYGPMEGLKGRMLPHWPNASGDKLPKVFMYLPGAHPLEETALQALQRLGWPVILHSRQPPKCALGPAQHFSPEPVDTQAVLKEADVFITHGSHGTCADALQAGCRQFLLPNSFERLILSYRMAQNELAILPQGNLSDVKDMEAQLVFVSQTTPPMLEKTSSLYSGYDPAIAAAELTEDLLAYFATKVPSP